MGISSNAEKDRLLDMPHGTAWGKLRKNILFSLLEKLDLNKCFVCESTIETSADLSIEHKNHWQRAKDPREAFFDLDNIAFSHLACNRPDYKQVGIANRHVGPDEMAWCHTHKQFLPREMFGPSTRWDGLNTQCRQCARTRAEEYRQKRIASLAKLANAAD